MEKTKTKTTTTTYKERLPRRYAATMKTLNELMNSKNERVRLQAVLRATEILLDHDRSIERVTIATERAAARKAEAEAGSPVSVEPETAKAETVDDFLARVARKTAVTELEDDADEQN